MAANNIVALTKENFAQEVLQSPSPVLVDFWAEWCGPCKQIAPALGELATEFEGKAKIAKVNIEEATNQQLAVEYGIRSIPTLLFFKDGQVQEQVVGLKSESDLQASIDRLA